MCPNSHEILIVGKKSRDNLAPCVCVLLALGRNIVQVVAVQLALKGRQTNLIFMLQGCWANSDDRANSDDFLGKSLELIYVITPTFSQILTA